MPFAALTTRVCNTKKRFGKKPKRFFVFLLLHLIPNNQENNANDDEQ